LAYTRAMDRRFLAKGVDSVDEFEQAGILLVEDNPLDAELMMRGLKDQKLANSITWVKDGGQASDRFGLSP
jgi:hypothetical protein